jgi:hypothetical protein
LIGFIIKSAAGVTELIINFAEKAVPIIFVGSFIVVPNIFMLAVAITL